MSEVDIIIRERTAVVDAGKCDNAVNLSEWNLKLSVDTKEKQNCTVYIRERKSIG